MLHHTIDGVRHDYEQLSYHTAIAKLITLTNQLVKSGGAARRSVVEPLVLMTAPLAPHVCEELWERLGHSTSLAHGPFPTADPAFLRKELISYPVQVRGKVRVRVEVPADADQAAGRVGGADRRPGGLDAGRGNATEGGRGPGTDDLDRALTRFETRSPDSAR